MHSSIRCPPKRSLIWSEWDFFERRTRRNRTILRRYYVVVESDRYLAERDAYAFQMTSVVGPDQVMRWAERLRLMISNLAGFPGPLSHTRDEEASAIYRREVRRLLYHGPSPRRSKQPVHVLFTLIPPAEDDPEGETVISLLRLLRGNQSLVIPDAPDPSSPNAD